MITKAPPPGHGSDDKPEGKNEDGMPGRPALGKHNEQCGQEKDKVWALRERQRDTEALLALKFGRRHHHDAPGRRADKDAEDDSGGKPVPQKGDRRQDKTDDQRGAY